MKEIIQKIIQKIADYEELYSVTHCNESKAITYILNRLKFDISDIYSEVKNNDTNR